ncbi:MAG: hypothetical protein Q4F39_08030 [Bacteroidia bacterium]|nr:hypothetical protein [Bacteroidia bacterium]
MNEDLEIKKLMSDYQPELTDSADFMAALNEKLDVVEDVKVYHELQTRKYRKLLLAALISGAVVGGLLIAFILLAPATFGEFHLLLDSSFFVFLMSYKTLFLVAGAILITAACAIPALTSRSASN